MENQSIRSAAIARATERITTEKVVLASRHSFYERTVRDTILRGLTTFGGFHFPLKIFRRNQNATKGLDARAKNII